MKFQFDVDNWRQSHTTLREVTREKWCTATLFSCEDADTREEAFHSFLLYQFESRRFAKYPRINNNFVYPALGLGGEAGEVLEKIKKICRDGDEIMTDEAREAIKKELGDVLWYVAALCSELGLSMADVASSNIDKLSSRADRGQLSGSGDNR